MGFETPSLMMYLQVAAIAAAAAAADVPSV